MSSKYAFITSWPSSAGNAFPVDQHVV